MSDELSVTVLGCSGSYARAGDACSGYLFSGGGTSVWVDCGPGTLANLQEHVELTEVDAIVVSHHHPDHCVELPVVYNALRYYVRGGRVPVFATGGVQTMCNALAGDGDTSDVFDWHIVGDGDLAEVGTLSFSFSRTDHPVETLAVRVAQGDASIVYTSDTGPGWSLTAYPPADVVVGEGTILAAQERPAMPHLSGRQLGSDARAAGAGRLVLIHVAPTSDPAHHVAEAEVAFGGPVDLAVTGHTYVAGPTPAS